MLGKLARLKCNYEVIHGFSAGVGKCSLQAGVQTGMHGQCVGHEHGKRMPLVLERTREGFWRTFFQDNTSSHSVAFWQTKEFVGNINKQ